MLAAAGERFADHPARDRVTLVEGDMRNLCLPRRFACVIVSARSFMHLLPPSDQRAALETFRVHLDTGGRLVLDLFDQILDLITAPFEAGTEIIEGEDPRTGRHVQRSVEARDFDLAKQQVHELLRIGELAPDGSIIATEIADWWLRWSFRQEIAWLLELTGFRVLAEYSDYQQSPPAYGREQLWLAEAV